jgi:RNA polymerase sigma factor (sigma-70 family)
MATSRISGILTHLRRAVLLPAGAGLTDGQLLEHFLRRGDEAALAALVRRHGPMVWGVCRRFLRNYHDAEDAFQATFLVLVRRADSVRPRGMVASWLHGVARRTALKARASLAKRLGRERQVATMPEPAGREPGAWGDRTPWLDEVLSRLPDRYRAVLVLCDLEGRTRKEAAAELGVPEGTVAGRLARARSLLARRLGRLGLAVPGGALAAAVSQQAAASVPAAVVSRTIKVASTLAAGAGVIPAQVAILTEGVLKAMVPSKLKIATVGLLLGALLGGAAAIYRTQAAEPPKPDPGNQTRAKGSTSQDLPRPRAAAQRAPEVRPPKGTAPREYVLTSKLMEAGANRPKEVFPRMTLDEGQLGSLNIVDGPQNLLANVIREEKIKIGTFFDMRVRRLGGNKVRLVVSFQRNEVETCSVSEIRVLGSHVQVIQDVELRKPVKVVFQKDARGSARRWVEITVEQPIVEEHAAPAATESSRRRARGSRRIRAGSVSDGQPDRR